MKYTMERITAWTLLLIGFLSTCYGDFYIASAPEEMGFVTESDQIVKRREIPGIINFLMGLPSYHLHRTESWPGMKRIDVFNPPKVNVLITLHLPKGNNFVMSEYVIKYSTDNLESSIPPIFELNSALKSESGNNDGIRSFVLENKFPGISTDKSSVEQMRNQLNEDDSLMGSLPFAISSLNMKNEADVHVFGEIIMMLDAINNLKENRNIGKQSVHVMLTSLDKLAQLYGSTSPQVEEAIKLFKFYIPQFIEAVKKEYHNTVLCEVDVTGAAPSVSEYLVRHSRNILQSIVADEQATNFTKLNLAIPNSAEFAVIFNIVLWVMIGFFLAALASTYVMFFMDPGKDNIIYRVTSQRIKID